jgi:hypothetical protein
MERYFSLLARYEGKGAELTEKEMDEFRELHRMAIDGGTDRKVCVNTLRTKGNRATRRKEAKWPTR